MIYRQFKDTELSGLGFGMMRLPVLEDGSTIDQATVQKMVDYAIAHGVNYFDTAAPYHNGMSEVAAGEALSKYPREKWHLASKFPGHQHCASYDPKAIFEQQLEKCKVDYFDFYLFHNVSENSLEDYMNPKWGMLDYFVEQRRLGRIRHLGMSSHARPETLKSILDGPYGKEIEFCQIQLNYLDWTLQDAREKCRLLNSRHIPIWVMEPVRGGRLANLGAEETARLKALRPDESIAAWGFRWLQDIEGINMILSGMSSLPQMEDNIRTFETLRPLSAEEKKAIAVIADSLHNSIPCTGCRYCCSGCPQGLDIPTLISAYNDITTDFSMTPMMQIEALPEDKRPSACLACGQCEQICPQGIHIPDVLAKLSAIYDKSPKWSEICVKRNEIAARSQKKG